MKKQFLIISMFFAVLMTELLQASPPVISPSMSRVYGNQYTQGVTDSQIIGQVGSLDNTFGSNGSLDIEPALAGSQAFGIQTLSNGNFLVVLGHDQAPTDAVVAMYNAEGSLQTFYGASGIFDLGAVLSPRATMLDPQGRLLVAGGYTSGSDGWLKRISADGSSSENFDTIGDWQFIAGLAQQSTGQILAAGFNGTYAQIGRYNLDGSLDTTFATSGFIVLDTATLGTSFVTGLYDVIVGADDKIYVFGVDNSGTPVAYLLQISVNGLAISPTTVTYLNGATNGSYKLAFNQEGNIILAAVVSNIIKVTALTTGGTAATGFTNFNSTAINSDDYILNNIVLSSGSDNYGFIYLLGSDSLTRQMAVICLGAHSGELNTAFNETGYNFFSIGDVNDSVIQAGSLAPDGQLYVPGYQINAGAAIPYVSRLNNSLYVYPIAQFPYAQEQGILDLTFGQDAIQIYQGVVNPFNGKYGPSLMQSAQDAMEIITASGGGEGVPPVGDILIGMNGYSDSSATSNMMFAWLTSEGDVDTNINDFGTPGTYPGFLMLDQESYANEYLTAVAQGVSGVVYVCGYGSDTLGGPSAGTILRAYTTSSTATWNFGDYAWLADEVTSLWKGVGLVYQSSSLNTMIFIDEGNGAGHITAYSSLGTLASWGDAGSGSINSTSYGLNMGPCYGGGLINALDKGNNLFAAYKDTDDDYVKVAAFIPDGSALLNNFGDGGLGVSVPLFAGLGSAPTNILLTNIRCCFNSNGDILVAAINGAGTALLFTLLSGDTGDVDINFGTAGLLTVSIDGSSSLILKDFVGVSDGMAVVTFYNFASDNTMYLTRIQTIGLDAGTLDETFNSQGSQAGVLPFKVGDRVEDYTTRVISSAIIQSTEGDNQGNIVMSAYESVTSNDSSPMSLRSYGDPGSTQVMPYPIVDENIPGTFDVAFDLVSDLGNAAAKVVYTYLSGNAHQGYSLIGYDNGTNSFVARFDITTNLLDPSFGDGDGIFRVGESLSGISTISIDAQNRIIVGGSDGSTPWAYQISENGDSAVAFGSFPEGMIAVNQIAQQTSGRYIVAGNIVISTVQYGIGVAFQDELVGDATTLAIDETFNPLAYTGSSPVGNIPGAFLVADALYSIAINTNDTILAVYTNSVFVVVADFTADGSGLVSGFNSGNILTTSIGTDSAATCRVAINNADPANFIIAASSGSGLDVQIGRYLSDGTFDSSFNSGSVLVVPNLGSAGITLSDLMITTLNQTIFLGYNSAGGNGPLFACRLDEDGVLDATWNPFAVSPDTPGVLTFATNSVVQMNGSSICIDGRIIAVGQQVGGTAGDPIVMYVYGDNYVTQVAQAPLEVAAGNLDYTIPGGSTGSWNLTGTLTGVPQKIAIYNNDTNGAIMVASSNGTNCYVTMLNADLSVGTATSGDYGTTGVVTFAGKTVINDMYLVGDVNSDTIAPIYVTGSNAGAMWGANISADGDTITYLASGSGLTTGRVIRQTNNGRILVGGSNGSSGVIAAFGAVTSDGVYPLDTSFGNNTNSAPNYGGGVYATGVNSFIFDMAVDSLDRIYIAYRNGAAIIVQRLLANGTAVDSNFSATFTTAVNSYTGAQINLVLDEDNNQLVVVARDGSSNGNINQVCRFNAETGSSTGSTSDVTVPSDALAVQDLFLDAEQNIYVVMNGDVIAGFYVARIASTSSTTIALDTTYAADSDTPGIEAALSGSMVVVTAGAYDPDRRTYFVGSDGSTTGYMARLYGDVYTSQVSEAIATAEVGSIDTSLQPNNTGEIDLSGQAGWSTLADGYKAYAIIENFNNDGTSFIAFGNGTYVRIGKVDADMNPVTDFGSSGLTSVRIMDNVNSITLDSTGNVFVAGSFSENQTVYGYTSSGSFICRLASTVVSTNGSVIVQQKSGRYIVGGYDGSGNGLIIAYQNESAIDEEVLPVDQTFGPAGSNGFYAIGVNAQVDDICIDDNDNIYFTYVNPSNIVCLGKLTANGSGLVNNQNSSEGAFNAGSIITTDIAGVLGGNPSRIAINDEGNILVGNTDELASPRPAVQVALYDGITGAQIGSTITVFNNNDPVLTKLVGSGSEFYGSIYDTAPNMTVFAVNSSGALDTNFGAAGVTTVGGATYEYVKAIYGLSVQADGKLVAVGYNNPSNDTETFDPSLMRFFGYEYVPQFEQAPNRVDAGHLDTTLWPSTGAFPLNHTANNTFNTLIGGYVVKRVYEYGNGIMTFVADSGSNTVVFQLLKDLTLNPDFNEFGWRQFSSVFGGTTGLYVDSLGNIFVCGTHSGASWVIGMDSTGENLYPAFNDSASLAAGNAISQQGMGRVILAGSGSVGTGQSNSNAYVIGYNNEGDLDITFGIGGQLNMGIPSTITDIAIDYWDRVITVANNSGSVILQRTTSSGRAYGSTSAVTTLTGGTAISTAVSGSNIKVVLDNGGRIVVAAATSTGYTLRSYNNDVTGTNNAGPVSIAPSGGSGNFILSNIYVTDDDTITLIGYRTSGQICVARFISTDGSLVLDVDSFDVSDTPGYIYTTIGSLDQALDGIIHADNRIMVVGSNSGTPNPYMGRVFGYTYVDYVTQGPIEGIAGTINPAFGSSVPTTGTYDLSTLDGILYGAQGKALIPVADGGYYIAVNSPGEGKSFLIKTISSGALDTTYNSGGTIPGVAGSGATPHYAPLGVNSILEDGVGNVLLVGTLSGTGWLQRYTSNGQLDTTFNGTGIITMVDTQATVVVEQTLARLVIAGLGPDGNGALIAYESLAPDGIPGTLDTTFNSTGDYPGAYSTGVANVIPTLVADQYDRLIFGILNPDTGDVDVYRLTPTGQPDITFGSYGIVSGAIQSAADADSVRVVLDDAGNIIVAATSSLSSIFSVRGFDNGTSTATGGNGDPIYDQLDVDVLSSPSVSGMVASSDGYTLILGNQGGIQAPSWIARITEDGQLDVDGFNPNAVGANGVEGDGFAGIFEYNDEVSGGSLLYNIYAGLAVNANGTLGMLGYSVRSVSPSYIPLLVSVYDYPYISQEPFCQDSKPVGTNDVTLGVSPSSASNLGISFYGSSTGSFASGQVARAIGLYDDNNNIVAIDGTIESGSGPSAIMMNMFDNDGILNPNFGDGGQQTVLDIYQNQYVRSMITFTSVQGVTKAILAGYVYNSVLSRTDSLLLQYILTPGESGLDDAFGGYDNNPAGIAFGDGQSLFSVAQQTNGRIIAAGLSQNNLGLLLGYGANGKLDNSFGNDGYQSASTGSSGIYTHAVDTNDRIVFAYNNGSNAVTVARYLPDGSALDSSFTASTSIATISGNTNMKVAVDSSNNVYAAAVIASGNSIMAKVYNGANGTQLHTITLTGTALGNASAVYTLGRVIVDAAGNTIIVACDTNATKVVVVRLNPSFVLDTTFNDSGYITYEVGEGNEIVTDAMIHPDGRILLVGTEEEII